MTTGFWMEVSPLMPELILGVSTMILLLMGAWGGKESTEMISRLAQWAICPFLIAMLVMMDLGSDPIISFEGLAITNKFTQFVNITILLATMVVLDVHRRYMKADSLDRFEYPILILLTALGMMVMTSADSLLTFYMGLELQSFSLYILVAIRRDQGREGEAAVKYFVLGALSSALILFGTSYLYGFLGTTSFEGIAIGLKAESTIPAMMYLAMGLVIAGMAFKISVVPFHMWAPDVYEGSPLMVTAFLASVPKLAAFALMVRLLTGPFLPFIESWQMVIAVIAALSIALGAYGALYQTNIKRLLAYSSISHMGYALTGLVPGTVGAVDSVLTYNIIYLITVLTTFVCLLNLRRRGQLLVKINDLAGLSQTYPMMAGVLSVLMFSLAGIPPLAGFFAKFAVFRSAVIGGFYPLAIIGVLASVVGAVYYLRIIKVMYFDSAVGGDVSLAFDQKLGVSSRVIIGAGAIVTLFFIAYPSALVEPIEVAARSLFTTLG